MKRKVLCVAAVVFAFVVMVAGLQMGEATANAAKKTVKKTTKVYLNQTKVSLYPGQKTTLKVKAVKPNKASKSVTWKSSNTKVATVSSNGNVTARSAGTVTITAISKSNKKAKATCKVTVMRPTIRINSCGALNINQTYSLTAKVNGPSNKVSWSTSNKNTATINSKGQIRFSRAGSVIVTAKANGVSTSMRVTALRPTLTIDRNYISLWTKGKTTAKINAIATGGSKTLVWSTSNADVATVKNGTVYAKGEGTAYITVKANGLSKSCKVSVQEPTIVTSKKNVSLKVGGRITVDAFVFGPDEGKNVIWTSADVTVATVTNKGVISAVAAGKTTITVSANGISVSVDITVSGKLQTENAQLSGVAAHKFHVAKDALNVRAIYKESAYVQNMKELEVLKAKIVELAASSGYDLETVFHEFCDANEELTIFGVTLKVDSSMENVKTITVSGSMYYDGTYEVALQKGEDGEYDIVINDEETTRTVTIDLTVGEDSLTAILSGEDATWKVVAKKDGTKVDIYTVEEEKESHVVSVKETETSYEMTYCKGYLSFLDEAVVEVEF